MELTRETQRKRLTMPEHGAEGPLRKELGHMIDVNITPSEHGPYLVSRPVHLTHVDGREILHPDQMALCRCGHSSNKPFCDGTHATFAFDGTLKN